MTPLLVYFIKGVLSMMHLEIYSRVMARKDEFIVPTVVEDYLPFRILTERSICLPMLDKVLAEEGLSREIFFEIREQKKRETYMKNLEALKESGYFG